MTPAAKAVRKGGWRPVRFPPRPGARASLRSGAALVAAVGKAVFYAVTGLSMLWAIAGPGLPSGGSLLAFVSDGLLGVVGVVLLASGLTVYALWVTANAVFPARPGGGTALARFGIRASLFLSGLAHGGLAYVVVAAWMGREVITRGCCDLSLGSAPPMRPDAAFAGIMGVTLVAWGVRRFGTAASSRVKRSIEGLVLPSSKIRGVLGLARGAVAARGLSFGLVGVHVLLLVFRSGPDRNVTLGFIERSFWERPLFATTVALGLLVYAFYEAVIARYRIARG